MKAFFLLCAFGLQGRDRLFLHKLLPVPLLLQEALEQAVCPALFFREYLLEPTDFSIHSAICWSFFSLDFFLLRCYILEANREGRLSLRGEGILEEVHGC